METIRAAKVVNNNDTTKKGLIQVRILPEMLDIAEANLPWIAKYSIGAGTSSTVGVHEIPEVGTFIRVVIEDWPFLKRIRYISDDYVEGLYIYSQATKIVAPELSTQTYPQPSFKCFKDGTISFHNSQTGEHGFFFKGGGYQLVDASGNYFINTKLKKVKIYNDLASLKVILKSLQETLVNIVTPGNITSPSGTCVLSTSAADVAKLTQTLLDLNNLLSD